MRTGIPLSKLHRQQCQVPLVVRPESAGRVVSEVRGVGQRNIWWVAVDDVARLGSAHDHAEVLADERGMFGFLREVPHFLFWKIRTFVSSKRNIELAFGVVPAQAVISVTVSCASSSR